MELYENRCRLKKCACIYGWFVCQMNDVNIKD